MKTLILLRHGKSDYPPGVADHERPLAERGRREATLAGRWLRAMVPPIDVVVCSTAARTRQTLACARIDAPVVYEPKVYDASTGTVIDLIRITPDDVETVLIVGHAPGMPWTAWELTANRDSEPADRLSHKFPTSAMAVLEFDRSWMDIDTGSGDLRYFEIPR